MNPDEKFTITLNIAGQTFRPRISRRDEELYRLAEKEINQIYEHYLKKYQFELEQLLRALILQFAVGKIRNFNALQNLLGNLDELNLDLEEFLETS